MRGWFRARLTAWVLAAAIAAAVVAAYRGSFGGPFVFDDVDAILENPTLHHLWPPSAPLSPPPGGGTTSGRPLLNLSLALNYAISREAVWSYHALNVLVHVLAGLVLFGIVRRTAGLRVGFAAALLWTLHPLQTEAVSYTVQRAESMCGLFYLLTLYAFIRGVEGDGQEGEHSRFRPWLWSALSWTACLCAVATKEVAATAPVLVFLFDRAFVSGTFRDAWRRHRRYHAGLGLSWILLAVLLAANGGNRGGTIGFHVGVSAWAYALTQFKALATYLRASVWPHPLVFEYGVYWVKSAADIAPYAAVVVPAAIATLVALWRRPKLGFLGAWFFVILAPTSSVVPGVAQMIAEHRMYLSLAAPMVLLVLGLFRAAERIGSLRPRPAGSGRPIRSGAIAWCAILPIAAAFGRLTWLRNRDYRSAIALWTATVAERPGNPIAHCDLGVALDEAGRTREAAGEYERALALDPTDVKPRYNLASIQAQTGHPKEAIANFERALSLDPRDARARCNYGNALVLLGRMDEGVRELRTSLRLNPGSSKAHNDLGFALARMGRTAEAISEYRAALALRPDDPVISYNLGGALGWSGRLDEAIARYREALRLRPEYPEAHNNLANALARGGHPGAAVPEYETALRQRPDYPEARFNLAVALSALGRAGEAHAELESLLREHPDFEQARRLLEGTP